MCFIGEGNIGGLRRKCEGDGKCRADHHLVPQTSHLLDPKKLTNQQSSPNFSFEFEKATYVDVLMRVFCWGCNVFHLAV